MRQGNDKFTFQEEQYSRNRRVQASKEPQDLQFQGREFDFHSMDQEGGSSSTMWTPGSPRLSFSRDFVQSDVFNPSSAPSSRLQDPCDFDFGMLALLRMDDDHPGAAVADELFQNGRLLPIDSARNRLHEEEIDAAAPAIVGSGAIHEERRTESCSSFRIQQQKQQEQMPKSPANRWMELFGLSRRSSLRSSSVSSSISETEPLNASSSSCTVASCSRASKLKLLFRSTSAGAGRRQLAAHEPSLGRSASESKVSSCCNDLHLQVVDARNADLLIRSRATGSHVESHPSIHAETGEEKVLRHQQIQHDLTNPAMKKKNPQRKVPKSGGSQEQQQQRRKALAEMKAGCCSSRTINKQNCHNHNHSHSHHQIHQERLQKSHPKNSSIDAWRVYSERMSNASSMNNTGSKVAEVLHMEVCMGQSMVVSRVAKAFVKKENQNHHGSSSSKIAGVAAKGA